MLPMLEKYMKKCAMYVCHNILWLPYTIPIWFIKLNDRDMCDWQSLEILKWIIDNYKLEQYETEMNFNVLKYESVILSISTLQYLSFP